jgi:hypothetical protein
MVGNRGTDSQTARQPELSLEDHRVPLNRIVTALAGHAIAIQIKVTTREQVLVGDGDVPLTRWRHKRLRGRGATRSDNEGEQRHCNAWQVDCPTDCHGRRTLDERSRLSFSSIALSTAEQ